MSEPNDDLLKALADLMYQGEDSPQVQDDGGKTPDEPLAEGFLERLAECERIVNA